MSAERRFDGVTFGKQNGRECIVYLRLDAMKIQKSAKFWELKSLNTEIKTTVDDESSIVTATVTDDGESVTYQWLKRHQDKFNKIKYKIVKCDGKGEKYQIELILTKTERKDWMKPFVEYLLEL